jgi:hypothetical protein
MDMDSNIDILISRVVDGVATRSDWESFEHLGAADPSAWRELALAQRQEQMLRKSVGDVVAAAERIELPEAAHAEHRLKFRLRRVAAWGGWAAAAAVTLAFLTRGPVSGQQQLGGRGVQTGGIVPAFESADQLRQAYIEKGKQEGKVVGEIPDRVIMSTKPTPDGGYELVFVRQIMERAKVNDLYQASTTEDGKLCPVRVRFVVTGGKSPS